jgi:hypothetical protein
MTKETLYTVVYWVDWQEATSEQAQLKSVLCVECELFMTFSIFLSLSFLYRSFFLSLTGLAACGEKKFCFALSLLYFVLIKDIRHILIYIGTEWLLDENHVELSSDEYSVFYLPISPTCEKRFLRGHRPWHWQSDRTKTMWKPLLGLDYCFNTCFTTRRVSSSRVKKWFLKFRRKKPQNFKY